MPAMDWFPARVAVVRPAATGCFHFDLDVPPPVAASYAVPGQFVCLKPEGIPDGMFALAQGPWGGQRFEFLVKRGTAIAEALWALAPDALVGTSLASGKGFPLERARGHNLLLVATGTGLAPMRSVISAVRRARRDFGRVELLFGAFTPAHFPWPDDVPKWEADGVAVRRVISEPTPGWGGEVGFVQRLVEKAPIDDTEVFLVGQREMVTEVRAMLTSRGVNDERVHLNF